MCVSDGSFFSSSCTAARDPDIIGAQKHPGLKLNAFSIGMLPVIIIMHNSVMITSDVNTHVKLVRRYRADQHQQTETRVAWACTPLIGDDGSQAHNS